MELHNAGAKSERIQGSVSKVLFHNPETGFFKALVAKDVDAKDGFAAEEIVVTGVSAAKPIPGACWCIDGTWQVHKNYGVSFRANRIAETMPESKSGVAKVLHDIEGIGKVKAQRLADRFGARVFEIAETEPKQLLKISGVKSKIVDAIVAYSASRKSMEIETVLAELYLGPKTRQRAINEFGIPFLRKAIRENPFRLIELPRVTFSKVDEWVLKTKRMPSECPERGAAIICEALRQVTEWGHTFARKAAIVENIRKMRLVAPISNQSLKGGFDMAIKERMLVVVDGEDGVGLSQLVYAEEDSAAILLRWIADSAPAGSIDNVDPDLLKMLTGEQRAAVQNAIDFRVSGMTGGAGVGKCLCPGTPVLFFNGEIKPVEKVREGDLLMGDDSTPRKVVGLSHGFSQMFNVVPVKGDTFGINENHVMTFKMQQRRTSLHGDSLPFDILDMPVKEFLNSSKRLRKEAKLFRSPVEFDETSVPLDPYFLGLWLGDGNCRNQGINCPDEEVVRFIEGFARIIDLDLHQSAKGTRCPRWMLVKDPSERRNHLLDTLRSLNVLNNKHIPLNYKANSRANRLELLAGLLDTDGYFAQGCYEIISKYEVLADDILFIARSLGYAAYKSEKTVIAYPDNVYYRVIISGAGDEIPTKIKRKQGQPRRQKKNVLHTGFKVEPAGFGEYYGVEVDGNHRHLLGDFTVVHNTTTAKAVIQAFGYDARKIIVTPTGKAARRAKEATGIEASTIHRFIGRVQSAINKSETPVENIIPDVVLVDETSMVDAQLLALLLRLLDKKKGVRIVFVGDVNQLPSISPGCVLGDLIESSAIPFITLTAVQRQSKKSQIIRNAVKIKDGDANLSVEVGHDFNLIEFEDPELLRDRLIDFVCKRLPMDGFNPINDVQVLVGQRTTIIGCNELNKILRDRLNPASRSKAEIKEDGTVLFRVGDKVMNTDNNYELGVVNGDQGVIKKIEFLENQQLKRIDPVVTVVIDGQDVVFESSDVKSLILAYAITVHKCVAPETIVMTGNGYQPISEIAERGVIATPDGDVRDYEKVSNPVMPGIEIVTSDGYRERITLGHGMDVWRDGLWQRVEGRDLNVGDILRLRLGEPRVSLPPRALPPAPEGNVRAATYDVPRMMSADLAEFLGMMVADGTLYAKGFRLVKRHLQDVDCFDSLCRTLFPGVSVIRKTMKNCWCAEINSTMISDWLTSMGGMSPNDKYVPRLVMSSSLEIRRRFLRGLFLDSGLHVGEHGVLDNIELVTSFERLDREVRVLLLGDGYIAGTTSGKCRKIILHGQQASRFANNVGFTNDFKSSRGEAPERARTRYMIPVDFREIDALSKWPDKQTRNNARRRGRISRTTAHQMELDDLLQYHYSKIKALTLCSFPAFCVIVPDGHRFVQNGFCGWNSQGSEYPVVVLVAHKTVRWSLQRELIYTGITRGKQKVVVFGREEDLRTAAKNPTPERNTRLAILLADGQIKG